MKCLLKSNFLLLLVLALPCWALDWSSLWQNNNQRGQQALEQQQFDQAAELFSDQAWQAYSHYRQGNYEKAAELFNQDNARSWYNKGNALAQLGRFDEAINAYEQALAKQPDFADAVANKALLEQLKQQQENQSDDGEKNNQQSSEQSGDEQSDSEQQNSDNAQNDQSQSESEPQQGNNQESDPSESQQTSDQGGQEESDEQQRAAEQDNEAEENTNDTAAQQNDEPKDNTDEEATAQAMQENELSAEELEQQQQLEQWLRSVPDDPGQLLRNKFRYQYEQNLRRQQHIDKESDQLW